MSNSPDIQAIDTPCLVVEYAKLLKNIREMQAVANKAGAELCPHIKTHKSLKIAQLQIKEGAAGLTCAKLSEAEKLQSASPNWFIAYPITGNLKFERLKKLNEKVKTRVSIESIESARELNSFFESKDLKQDVMLKIETGLGRTGIDPAQFEGFLQQIKPFKGIHPVGVFTHEGMAYRSANLPEARKTFDKVIATLLAAATTFERILDHKAIVSPGCSVTAPLLKASDGVKEVRPGAYVFGDVNSINIGNYKTEECSLTVITTIVAVKPDGRVIIDAGSKTLSSDQNPVYQYGMVIGQPAFKWVRLTEEHGILTHPEPQKFKVGDKLKIIPAHVCTAVNLHDEYWVRMEDGNLERWKIEARGCVL